MAEWILAKLCRHDPWVPTMVFNQIFVVEISPLEGERGI